MSRSKGVLKGSTITNDPLNLDESGEWAGLWWLPDEPEHKVPGWLRYEPMDDLVLSLIGTFEDRIMSSPSPDLTVIHEGRRSWDVIHGAAEQREVTLLGCVPNGGKRNMFAQVKSPDKQTVVATTAIIGAQLSEEDDAAFSAAEVSVEDLGLWAASTVYEVTHGLSEGRLDGTSCISVRPVGARSVVVDGTECRLMHTHTVPFVDRRKGETSGRTRDRVSIQVVPTEPFSLSAALKYARLLQDLIALATHRAAGVIWLRLEVAGTLPNGQPRPRRVAEVLHRGLRIGEKPFRKAEFNAMREAMLAQVPEERRDRLKGTIRNDPTLRDRLHDLAARPDQEAIALLVPDVDHWARRTTRARNNLAHEGSTPDHCIDELIAVVEVTTSVVILNVLHELGLPAERQRQIVQEHPELRATSQRAREWLVVSKP